MNKNDIMVSICCITYNQEKYIKDAIESFLMQKADFKYEIIIRDDASTDNTAKIIREYEKNYPDIIKPIYEKENEYSKGIEPFHKTFKKAMGKYIALCEGDDYWIDDYKLQKQIDYMEKNEKCTFCFHNAKILYINKNKTETYIDNKAPYKRYLKSTGIYTADNIHLIRCNASIPTASFMFRKKHTENLPKFYFEGMCSDMPLKLIMTSYGYAYYMNEVMSVYRKETGISVTDGWLNKQTTDEQIQKRTDNMIYIINEFDKFTNYKYTEGLKLSIKYYELQNLMLQNKNKEILKSDYRKYYKIQTSDKLCLKLLIKAYVPKLYEKCKKIKNRRQ